jgi:hypothetical protein
MAGNRVLKLRTPVLQLHPGGFPITSVPVDQPRSGPAGCQPRDEVTPSHQFAVNRAVLVALLPNRESAPGSIIAVAAHPLIRGG